MRRALALLTVLLILGPWVAVQASPQPAQAPNADDNDTQVIAGPIAEKVTSSSAVVWWQTTVPAESILVYGTAPDDMHQRVQRPWNTTTHEVSLKKLQPATDYYLAILQPDQTTSATSQFTTQPRGYAQQDSVRITNGPLFEQITPDAATVAWSTNRPSSFVIHYGTDSHNLDQTTKVPWAPTTHRVVLHRLRPDTHYYFTIESSQQPPDTVNLPAQIYAFRTLPRGQQALNIGPRR